MVQEGKAEKTRFESVDEVIDFAIGQEEKAAAFYRDFAEKATYPGISKMCLEMAVEEDRHKLMLENLKAGLPSGLARDRVVDLKISDYLRSFWLDPDADQQDLLIAAMKSESKAEQLYLDLAEICTVSEAKGVLLRLAAEEGSHKDAFEKQYDDHILRSN
ncbi:MAG: ferritin family protein [Lysobacterales bacterium]|jgi:rubrerythrin